METITVVTQIGKVEIDVTSRADNAFITLGLTNEMIEKAMCATIGEKIASIGGEWSKDGKRPAKWDN
jgi:hypothetical protein